MMILERIKMYFRGVRRVNKPATRGRIYEKTGGQPTPQGGNSVKPKAMGKATVRARVIRKDGTIEDLGVISDG